MRACLDLASAAAARGEVPVGAVVVLGDEIVGASGNRCEERGSPLAHAEMEALAAAFDRVGAGRLPDAELFCTLEPCLMCTGAALHARVRRIVFGARDPKFGACGSLYHLPTDRRLNHRCDVDEGLFAAACSGLLVTFFKRLR